MIGNCTQCGKEKGLHGNGLCNACHQKNWRAEHRLPVNPNKVERDNCGKFRKWGGALLAIRDAGADLIPEEVLALIDDAGTRLSHLGLTGGTSPDEPDQDQSGDDFGGGDAEKADILPTPSPDPLLKKDVIKALQDQDIRRAAAIQSAHDTYSPGATFDQWFKAALASATGRRNATQSTPVALPEKEVGRNATSEEERCVARPVEEASNATEKFSVALPLVTIGAEVQPKVETRFRIAERAVGQLQEWVLMDGDKVYDCFPTKAEAELALAALVGSAGESGANSAA